MSSSTNLEISRNQLDEYYVKTIQWKEEKRCVITQNENGPCPLVAICNVLFLRGDLKIEPEDRELVSFEYLVERLGDYLLNHINEGETEERHQLEAALNIIPKLKTGLDSVVWESLGDTDQGSSQFFNGLFNRPALPREHEDIDLDHAIAMSLQHQERQQQQQQQQQQQRQQQEIKTVNDNVENKRKRKSQCVIS
ncbi:hypothetical protein RMCBS344292_03175 [Rhizopus microsporus]|nr:hypothetical protein RMCBS344292_03175 [Rhizopus microsporus]